MSLGIFRPLPRLPKLRPSLSTLAALREPLIGGEDGEEKKGDNSFNPSVNASLLSLGLILKRGSPTFSHSKEPSGGAPGKYFIQGMPNSVLRSHRRAHTSRCFYERGPLLVLYSHLADAARAFIVGSDGIVLEESNSEEES